MLAEFCIDLFIAFIHNHSVPSMWVNAFQPLLLQSAGKKWIRCPPLGRFFLLQNSKIFKDSGCRLHIESGGGVDFHWVNEHIQEFSRGGWIFALWQCKSTSHSMRLILFHSTEYCVTIYNMILLSSVELENAHFSTTDLNRVHIHPLA